MRVNKLVASTFLSAMLALQAWTLHTVFGMAQDVATLKAQVAMMQSNHIASK